MLNRTWQLLWIILLLFPVIIDPYNDIISNKKIKENRLIYNNKEFSR